MGWDVINMIQYLEVIFVKEFGICYVNIFFIIDYDVGFEGRDDIKFVIEEEVYRVFRENNDKVKKFIYRMIEKIDVDYVCEE